MKGVYDFCEFVLIFDMEGMIFWKKMDQNKMDQKRTKTKGIKNGPKMDLFDVVIEEIKECTFFFPCWVFDTFLLKMRRNDVFYKQYTMTLLTDDGHC